MGEETVRVLVRCRPLNTRERNLSCKSIVAMDTAIGQVALHKPDSEDPPKAFTFDGVYDMESNTKQIYEDLVFGVVESVLEGYNGTVFAYGQTGCGKSFSMEGIPDHPEHRGITPRSFEHVFQEVAVRSNTKFLVRVSYLEIYNEMVRDLLSKDPMAKLELKEHPEKGVYVKDLSMNIVHNADEVLKLMARGTGNRSVGATAMNADSSRSHSIFTVYVEMCDSRNGDDHFRAGKLNLVDLAGSERQSKTQAEGDRLKEATKINLSLSALGNVISALVDGKAKHIPYRDSKLTRLLQDSLGGNTKTLMVAAVSPADNNYDETLSTLRYANRAKNIKNKATINEDPKDTLLREYQAEIQRLKDMLLGKVAMDPAALAAFLGGSGGAPAPAAAAATPTRALPAASVAPAAAPATPPPPQIIERIVTKEVIVEKPIYIKEGSGEKAKRSEARERRSVDKDRHSEEKRLQTIEENKARAEESQLELKRAYDKQLEDLQRMCDEQRLTNEKLEEEFERLTVQYTEACGRIETDTKHANNRELQAIAAASGLAVSATAAPAVVASLKQARVTSASSTGSRGAPAAAPLPSVAVAVRDEDGTVIPALLGPGGVPIAARITASGELEPLHDDDGQMQVLVGVDGQPAPQVFVIDEPVAVMGPEGGAMLAVRNERGQLTRATMGADGFLHPSLRSDGLSDTIFGPDGLPARELSLGKGPRAPRLKPVAVLGPDGQPMLAVLENNVPVRAQLNADCILVPVRGSDGKSIPVKGHDGAAAQPLEAAVAAVAVPGPDGNTVVGQVASNGTLIRTEVAADGHLRPVIGPDGVREVVEDVVVPLPPPEPVFAGVQVEDFFDEPSIPAPAPAVSASAAGAAKGAVTEASPAANANSITNTASNTVTGPAPSNPAPASTAAAAAAAADATSAQGQHVVSPSGDRSQSALQRQLQAKLHELEGRMVAGGEKAADKSLQENLDRKRRRAKEKELARLVAAKNGDDDTALEEIYGSLQDELRGKDRKLNKAVEKLKAAKAEIGDLQSEFERERESMLETMRKQQEDMQLYKQIAERMQMLVRRESNYACLDRIVAQAVFNDETGEWQLPKVTSGMQPAGTSMSSSSVPASARAHHEHLSSAGSNASHHHGGGGAGVPPRHSSAVADSREPADDAYLEHLKAGQQSSSYFQPKRAAQLLGNMEQRQRDMAMQMEQRISRFDALKPIQSNRSVQLLQQDPYASLDQSPKNPRRRDEPGGVSLTMGATPRSSTRSRRPGHFE